jgi:hypothetical protein
LIGLLSYIRLQLGFVSCFEFYVAAQGKTQQQQLERQLQKLDKVVLRLTGAERCALDEVICKTAWDTH